MDAEILATGSELLGPDRLDTNSLWLTARLDEVGVPVRRKTIVGDDRERMREALEDALRRAELVVCTGGLGPTEDDVTREAAAAATGRPLVHVPALEEELRRRFAERGLKMADNNRRQAWVPQGAEPLPNRTGTAPGIRLELGTRVLALLPGPPREMQPMFLEHVLPRLSGRAAPMIRRVLKVTGLTESGMDTLIAPLLAEFPDVEQTVNFTKYDLEIRLSTRGPAQRLEEISERLRELLGVHLFSEAGERLEVVVARLLRERGLRLAVTEVASGGRTSTRLAEAGAALVGATVLREPGPSWPEDEASSVQAALEARRQWGTDLALVVGAPLHSGERAEAWVALADEGGTTARSLLLPAAPDMLPRRASQVALDALRRRLLESSTAGR